MPCCDEAVCVAQPCAVWYFLAATHAVPANNFFRSTSAQPMPHRCTLPPQTDVDTGLLATFEYLQSLGMSSEQMYQCLAADSSYCSPTALPRLSECDAAPGSCAAAQPAGLALPACMYVCMCRPAPQHFLQPFTATLLPILGSPHRCLVSPAALSLMQRRWPPSGWARAWSSQT